MTTKIKIYIAAGLAAAVIAGYLGEAVLSDLHIKRLERAADAQRSRADRLEEAARQAETDAARYREKEEYLERRLAVFETEKRKKDEKLEDLETAARAARSRVASTRRPGPTAADTVSLCKQLADVGHDCGDEPAARK